MATPPGSVDIMVSFYLFLILKEVNIKNDKIITLGYLYCNKFNGE